MSKCAESWALIVVLVAAGCGSGAGPASGSGGEGGTAGQNGTGGKGGKGGNGARPDAGADAPVAADAAVPVDVAPDLASAEFCDGYAAKFCGRLLICSRPYLDGVYGDMAGCQQRLELECRTEATLPGSGLTGAAGQACGDAMVAAECEDVLGNSVPACHLKGTLAKGAACGSNTQCASGFCRMPETAFCGKCDTPGAADGPCDSDDSCEFPLRCSAAGRCAKPAVDGELCNETRPCKEGLLFCAADNTCKRRSGEGKACNSSAPAPRQPCEIGFTCRPSANGLCRGIRLVGDGQTCGISASGSTVILCTGSGSCVNQVCRPPGKDGERCTPSPLGDSGGCLPPALCLEGLCKLPDPASCH
jgi:hypothetical protein